jgi:hypothetical protein
MSDKPWPPVVCPHILNGMFPGPQWHPFYEGPTLPPAPGMDEKALLCPACRKLAENRAK